jgi:hypothetical protein
MATLRPFDRQLRPAADKVSRRTDVPRRNADGQPGIDYEKDGGGTTATLIVGGLIVLMVAALVGLLYLTFAG